MMDIDAIFAADLEQPPLERSLPWQESKSGITVVIEPKPHWASDLRTFRQNSCEYCYYQDWLANGPRARFFTHISLCGEDLLHSARAMIRQEIVDGLWRQLRRLLRFVSGVPVAGPGCLLCFHWQSLNPRVFQTFNPDGVG